jgi:hypothetical protein
MQIQSGRTVPLMSTRWISEEQTLPRTKKSETSPLVYKKRIRYSLQDRKLKGLDQLPPFRISQTLVHSQNHYMEKKIRKSQCFPGNGRNVEREKSRLEWGGGCNFVPLCRVHNWFDGRKEYWSRYLYVSRGGGGTKGPARSALKCVFFRQALLCCGYLYVIIYTKNSYMYLSQN